VDVKLWPIWIHTLQVAFGNKSAFVAVRSVCALRLLSHAAATHWKSLAKMELLLSPAGLSMNPRSSSDSHSAQLLDGNCLYRKRRKAIFIPAFVENPSLSMAINLCGGFEAKPVVVTHRRHYYRRNIVDECGENKSSCVKKNVSERARV
jgi:hypothetical protein